MPLSQRISASGSQEFVCDRLFLRPTVPWQRLTRWAHVDHRLWLRLYHTSEGGGTGWNCKKFDGNRWNHKDSCYLLAATYYTPPVFSRAILPLPFSGISSSLLFHLSSSILLSDLFFSFSFSFFHEWLCSRDSWHSWVVFLRTRNQSRRKRYALNEDIHHVVF